MVKKGFMKTMEIVFAIVLTTLFLMMVIPDNRLNQKSVSEPRLIKLESNQNFRDFIGSNEGCFNSSNTLLDAIIRNYLSMEYDFIFCINDRTTYLPNKDVITDTMFYAGNISELNYKTIRLYMWIR